MIVVAAPRVINRILAAAVGAPLQQAKLAQQARVVRQPHQAACEEGPAAVGSENEGGS
jgi:hypothetical protein